MELGTLHICLRNQPDTRRAKSTITVSCLNYSIWMDYKHHHLAKSIDRKLNQLFIGSIITMVS